MATVCGEGYLLNPKTGKCRKVRILKECKAGKERNPATRKCVTPCKAGQERNPKTNRCRNTVAKPRRKPAVCKPGYEKNAKGNCVKECGPLMYRGSRGRCRMEYNRGNYDA